MISPSRDATSRLRAATRLIRCGNTSQDLKTAGRAIGTAHMLAGNWEDAESAFMRIPEEMRDAGAWSDLAAAEIAIATSGDRADRWLSALDASNHALTLAPHHPEASFNRALILEGLGAIPLARRQWQDYLRLEPASQWSDVARIRLHALPLSQQGPWAKTTNIAQLDDEQLEQLIRRSPEYARLYAEGPILAEWAEAFVKRDSVAATRALDIARKVARAIQRRSGESLLAEAIALIDAGHDPERVAEAQLHYRAGRVAYKKDDMVTAERELRRAAVLFSEASSPIAAIATSYLAGTLFDRNEVDKAEALLRPLLAHERLAGSRHPALVARILHQHALCDAVRGHWSASLAGATESMTIYRRLGESVNAAAAEAIVSEDYDFLGQPDRARSHAIAALRGCAAEDPYRARVILAAMCRTELRGHRWRLARPLIAAEDDFAKLFPHLRLDSDMYMRSAVVEAHRNDRRDERDALASARRVAAQISDRAMRSRVLADIDAVEGGLSRDTDPSRAVTLLSSAVAFQRSATRPLLLPELFLERGRAHLRLGEMDAARKDFESGILELERQRTKVFDAALRPGIFDDASELFEEAVRLELARGDAIAALAYVERGRARTMLEQMERTDIRPLPLPFVQQSLSDSAAIVEYLALTDRLITFVITADNVTMQAVPISREQLHKDVALLLDATTTHTTDAAFRRAATVLHESLVAPVANRLRGKTVVMFVPDNVLDRVPFAALVDRRTNSYFVERYLPITVPSSSVYALAERHAAIIRDVRAPRILILANPEIPRDQYPSLPSLDAAESEAHDVRSAYRSGTLLTRRAATAARFLQDAALFDVVHFGGHAITNERDPLTSALVCASSDDMGGTVTTRSIAQTQFVKTRAVILAACSTMTGRNAAIEGTSSIAKAFLIAGVPAVIGTLWDIDDQEAGPIVGALHTRLSSGTSPAVALREAQLEAIRSASPDRREARRWAAFTVTGASGTRGEVAQPSRD